MIVCLLVNIFVIFWRGFEGKGEEEKRREEKRREEKRREEKRREGEEKRKGVKEMVREEGKIFWRGKICIEGGYFIFRRRNEL